MAYRSSYLSGNDRGMDYSGMGGGGDEYDRAYTRAQAPAFSYSPDPNDPELTALNTGIQRRGQFRRQDQLNEISRAGLLGTSAGLNAMGGLDTDISRELEGAQEGVYSRRRNEAYGAYQGDVDYRRQLQLLRLKALLEQQLGDQQARSDLFASVGSLAGVGLGLLGSGGGA